MQVVEERVVPQPRLRAVQRHQSRRGPALRQRQRRGQNHSVLPLDPKLGAASFHAFSSVAILATPHFTGLAKWALRAPFF
jgi:hypothetical protein